jgi:hypothetical protein
MADEHEATALVVVLDVIVPRIPHIVILEPLRERGAGAPGGQSGTQTGQRDLPVQRRVESTRRSETRKLLPDDIQLRLIGDHVAVRRRVCGHRRVDVETIDRRSRSGRPLFPRQLAVGCDHRRREIDIARVLAGSARPAQPRLPVAVIVPLRQRGGRLHRGRLGRRVVCQRQTHDERDADQVLRHMRLLMTRIRPAIAPVRRQAEERKNPL